MDGVDIIRHSPKHEDSRGQTIGYISKDKFKEILILRRNKGSISGNHYHTGSDKTRNPEIQYLVSGRMQLTVRNLATGKEEVHLIEPDTEVRIAPNIFHKMEAMQDVVLLEFHTAVSDYTDVVRL